jgi:hypothetical protein
VPSGLSLDPAREAGGFVGGLGVTPCLVLAVGRGPGALLLSDVGSVVVSVDEAVASDDDDGDDSDESGVESDEVLVSPGLVSSEGGVPSEPDAQAATEPCSEAEVSRGWARPAADGAAPDGRALRDRDRASLGVAAAYGTVRFAARALVRVPLEVITVTLPLGLRTVCIARK